MITKAHLVRLCDLLAEHRSISHWRVSALAHGNGQYFHRLKKGSQSVQTTMDKVAVKFSKLWPSDLPWPEDIPRPVEAKMAEENTPLNKTKSHEGAQA